MPEKLMLAIGKFVKTIFLAMAAAITFGTVGDFNRQTVREFKGTLSNAAQYAFGILAILIPINVARINYSIDKWENQ